MEQKVSVKFSYKCMLLCLFLLTTSDLYAAVNIDRTRVIMNGDVKSLSVTLSNQSKSLPYLAQSWVEDSSGKRSETYFLALPPLQRIDPLKKSQVRIMALPSTETLPKDRETLFYFNVREIPPKSDKQNVLQIALQSRLKMFWRPTDIKKAPNVRTEEKLNIIREKGKLILDNTTPYYITLGYLGPDNKGNFRGFESEMVAPFSKKNVNVNFNGDGLDVGYIDDFGGLNINHYHCTESLCSLENRANR
ncbi:fimbria/pilus periplasmic chaperone [Salmonella enterica]|nr:fimbria/pilus periplasmic chaperone [Salmonella enterica]EHM9013182.1 fimbria/pilus periplasmic chaperone [Salmonella enterica]EHM9101982.1 fimbria/pilus periplasmic chaperone [Salmonella enterica]EHM9337884.1 fimbria/pilus periplasmic chaperone [Salmonella enterica]EIE1633239.1 fimbria/pilus periplasmic chaperone [Salmonella enterica]